jgi:hypothetical protein
MIAAIYIDPLASSSRTPARAGRWRVDVRKSTERERKTRMTPPEHPFLGPSAAVGRDLSRHPYVSGRGHGSL